MDEPHLLSVVVATHRRPEWLLRCLRSLEQAARPACGFEVIVVDDAGGLPDGLDTEFRALDLRWVSLAQNVGQTRAQAKGVSLARGDLLAFLDDDAVVDAQWLTAIVAHFKQHADIPAFLGRIFPIDSSHILVRMRQQVYERRHRDYLDPDFRSRLCQTHGWRVRSDEAFLTDHLSGGNCAIRRETLEAIGGLAVDVPYGADDALARRLVDAGYAIGYNPDMIIRHQHSNSWRTLVRHAYLIGRGRETSRLLEGGNRSIADAGRILWAILTSPFSIAAFPEMLTADRNKLKVHAVYTLHELLVSLGRLSRFLGGVGASERPRRPAGQERQSV